MEKTSVKAYERRMRRFNVTVIIAALAALAIVIAVSWPFLQ
jgi:hypothetical protein